MDEKIEKIYCCDGSGDGNSNIWPLAAMMNGGMGNGMWNNPFVYLVWMMFAGRFFNNGGWDGNGCQGAQNIEMQNQLQAIRSQLQDNQNSNLIMDGIKGNTGAISQLASNLNCDFNTLNAAICDVRAGIDKLSGQVGFSAERVINAVNSGSCSVIQALKDCCCQTQKEILRLQADIQLQNCQQTNTIMQGINTINTGLERGFSQTAYETQRQTCDIINAGNANTQRIVDLLNGHWSAEDKLKIQDLKSEISQLKQTQQLLNAVRGECGCNNSCQCF